MITEGSFCWLPLPGRLRPNAGWTPSVPRNAGSAPMATRNIACVPVFTGMALKTKLPTDSSDRESARQRSTSLSDTRRKATADAFALQERRNGDQPRGFLVRKRPDQDGIDDA